MECEAGVGTFESLPLSYLLVHFSHHETHEGTHVMNDSEVSISNTPIFDQLARERDYARLVTDGPVGLRPVPKWAGVSSSEAVQRVRAYVGEGVPASEFLNGIPSQPAAPQAKIAEPVAVHPLHEAPEKQGTPREDTFMDFIANARREFLEANPGAVITSVTPKYSADGSVSIVVEAMEPKTSEHAPEGLSGRQMELYRNAILSSGTVAVETLERTAEPEIQGPTVSGTGISMIKQRTEVPPRTSIGEDVADTLYMKPMIPKPLVISDEEIDYEE